MFATRMTKENHEPPTQLDVGGEQCIELSAHSRRQPLPPSTIMAATERRIGKVLAETSALFLCDMQDVFSRTVQYFPQIVEVSGWMLSAARILNVPAIVTEHIDPGVILSVFLQALIYVIIEYSFFCDGISPITAFCF